MDILYSYPSKRSQSVQCKHIQLHLQHIKDHGYDPSQRNDRKKTNQHGPFWKYDSFLWNRKKHRRLQKSSWVTRILPPHTPYFFHIHLNIILVFTPKSPEKPPFLPLKLVYVQQPLSATCSAHLVKHPVHKDVSSFVEACVSKSAVSESSISPADGIAVFISIQTKGLIVRWHKYIFRQL